MFPLSSGDEMKGNENLINEAAQRFWAYYVLQSLS